MKPVIVLNLKAYRESTGDAALRLCEIASEVSLVSGVRIIVAPQAVDLRACARVCEVFAQHSDAMDAGAFTGSITPNALKDANALGSLLNHSEKRMPHETIGKTVAALREAGLNPLCAARMTRRAHRWLHLHLILLLLSRRSLSEAAFLFQMQSRKL